MLLVILSHDCADQGGFLDEDENDDVADVSDEELAGDDDAANSKSKSRQMQVCCKNLYY